MLFEPFEIKNLYLPNRIAVAPIATATANADGTPSDKTEEIYRDRAASGAGLVIVEHNAVNLCGSVRAAQLRAEDDAAAAAQRPIAAAAESAGGASVVQINHGGACPMSADIFAVEGYRSLSPSGVKVGNVWDSVDEKPYKMTEAEIRATAEDFVNTAVRLVKRAGYGGVQIHACHSYLLGQFLSPLTNLRGDSYGGSDYKRAKLLYEIADGVRQSLPETVLSVRLGVADTMPDEPRRGLSPAETVPVARELAKLGVNLICVSGNLCGFGAEREDEAYFAPYASAVRDAVGLSVSVICTGGIRRAATAERLLRNGVCDMVGVGRPLAERSGLIAEWKEILG